MTCATEILPTAYVGFVSPARVIPGEAEHGRAGILDTAYARSARREPSRCGFKLDVVTVDDATTIEAFKEPKTETASQRASRVTFSGEGVR